MIDPLLTREEFERLITQSIEALPPNIQKDIENVEFVLDEKSDSPYLGFYSGIPLTKRGNHYAFVLPDKITIYTYNIEKQSYNREHLERLVKKVVWHEIGHYFGYSETEIRKLEKKWNIS